MKRNFLPSYVGIAMTKSQFCFCTGITPYNLRQILNTNLAKWSRLGYSKSSKLLMPSVIREICESTGLQIDLDLYAQYVHGSRSGVTSTTIAH